MENNNIDVFEQLRIKNQEMFINKLFIDLDNASESLILFYNNYCDSMLNNIVINITSYCDVSIDNDKKMMINEITESFLTMFKNKISIAIKDNVDIIKNDIKSVDSVNYEKKLNEVSVEIVSQISAYYQDNIHLLLDEVTDVISTNHQLDIQHYLCNSLYNKMISTLKDKLMYMTKLINNNYDENTTKLQSINEKTLK